MKQGKKLRLRRAADASPHDAFIRRRTFRRVDYRKMRSCALIVSTFVSACVGSAYAQAYPAYAQHDWLPSEQQTASSDECRSGSKMSCAALGWSHEVSGCYAAAAYWYNRACKLGLGPACTASLRREYRRLISEAGDVNNWNPRTVNPDYQLNPMGERVLSITRPFHYMLQWLDSPEQWKPSCSEATPTLEEGKAEQDKKQSVLTSVADVAKICHDLHGENYKLTGKVSYSWQGRFRGVAFDPRPPEKTRRCMRDRLSHTRVTPLKRRFPAGVTATVEGQPPEFMDQEFGFSLMAHDPDEPIEGLPSFTIRILEQEL